MSDADDTIRLRPKRSRRAPLVLGAAAAVALLLVGGVFGYMLVPASGPGPAAPVQPAAPADGRVAALAPPPAPSSPPPSVPRSLPAIPPPNLVPAPGLPSIAPEAPIAAVPKAVPPPGLPALATEAQVLASAPAAMQVRRFALQPDIVIVQFPTLADQARALNRTAALVERAGFPRDRVLDDSELDRGIRQSGNTPETLYYGHDYRAADLQRFFAEADRAGLALTAQEMALRAAMDDWGWHHGGPGALISLVRDDPAIGIDQAARATILRHELSHGLYFTSAAYAEYAKRFWAMTLTDRERRRFRSFLSGEGYDASIEDLMVNETQAYLMHTQDPRFFNAAAVGMTPTRLDTLRVLFLTGMPPSWLRDCTTVPAASGGPAMAAP